MNKDKLEHLMRETLTEGYPEDVMRLANAIEAAERERVVELVMKNGVRGAIESVLRDVHIESGRKDEWQQVVSDLEAAIKVAVASAPPQ